MTEERQQIDRISTEVGAQTTLLDQALAAIANKAAGGGGGGSIETCSVRLQGNSDAELHWYSYQLQNDSGEIETDSIIINDYAGITSFDITLDNVICGSMLVAKCYFPNGLKDCTTDGAVLAGTDYDAYSLCFHITATAGAQATIYIAGDD